MRLTTTAALAVVVATTPVAAARADFPRLGIFRKKTKEEPPQRVKQLLDTLKSDTDEKKRKSAAGELQNHDPRTNTDLIPTLINTLQRDPSPGVRAEAAETIGKLKPVAQPAGVALEQTQTGDPSDDVRKAAQRALWDYHLNGYRSSGANPAYPQTAEPPLAKPRPATVTPPPAKPTAVAAQPGQPRPITTGIGKGAIYPQTIEPPLAKPRTPTVTPPTPSLTVPPLPRDDGKPPSAAPIALPSVPPPPSAPAAPTVPAGPIVPTIPPPE